jgi:DNA-binding NtrC family response regulator
LSEQGEFRSDLYYRLNVLSIDMPPLSDRNGDIILLARHFASQTARRYGLTDIRISKEAEELLCNYSWPGNIREMKHLIERAVLLSGGGQIDVSMLSLEDKNQSLADHDTIDDMTLGEAELSLIRQALERTDYNVSKAARELGITRMALRYRLKKYNL